MIIPCALALKDCLPCTDDPIRNITAEAPDVDVFIGFRDFKWNPPLGVTYFQLGCKNICFSDVSQEEANLCALQGAEDCVWHNATPPVHPPVPPGPNGPNGRGPNLPPQNPRNSIRRFRNTVQTCDVKCPDGSPYTATVPAGTITELSQALADEKAKSLACKLAQRNLFCITSATPPSACVGDDYFFILSINDGEDLIWSIDGDLPPGLDFDPFDAVIIGTPLVGGSYTFIIEVSDSLGRFQSKVMTICVMEIVTAAALPDAATGVAYAEPLIQQPATVSSEVWTLVSGSLPDGIVLAPNGSLTGIPTTNGVSSFTLKVDAICEGSAVSCQKDFTLEVGGCNCGLGGGTCNIDFSAFSWNGFFLFANNPGDSATGTALGDTLSCDLFATADPFVGDAEVQVTDTPNSPFIITNTSNCSFKLKINLITFFAAGFSVSTIGFKIFQDGVLVFHVRKGIGLDSIFPDVGVMNMGCNEYDIPLIAAINSKIEIAGDASASSFRYARCASTGALGSGSAGISMTMKLCNT